MVPGRETRAEGGADLYFGPFRLEQTKRLCREEQWVEVRPRSLAVLRYLAERSGRLVTREELLQHLWPRIYVSKTVVRVCITELRQGQVENGLAAVTEALRLTETNLDRFWEAELYRLKGELLLNAERGMQNDERKTKKKGRASSPIQHSSFSIHRSAEAEACFLKAIAIAQQQGAKSLELRAAMSLSRLWQHQGKKAEAHKLLSDVYNWFTEGFATKDLREAKALLDTLSG